MEGSLTQLQLKNYLINDKKEKHSLFSHNYKNYGKFVRNTLKFNFNSKFDFDQNVSFRIDKDARYGDFISNILLKVELPTLTGNTGGQTHHYTDGVGNALIEKITLKIGGQVVDSHCSEWLDVWSSLNINEGRKKIYNNMVRKTSVYDEYRREGILLIPLQFWFCQNNFSEQNKNMIFPLVSFKNTPIEIIVKTRKLNDLITYDGCTDKTTINEPSKSIISSELLIDFIVLENEERQKYLQAKNQIYLINQVQENRYVFNANQSTLSINLKYLRYPVTELIWVFRSNDNQNKNHYFNYSNGVMEDSTNQPFFTKMKLSFDGRERIVDLDSEFFSELEPFKYHQNVVPFSRINSYSFSLDPINFSQPSGSCNFSELHTPTMEFKLNNNVPVGEIILFAVNYNVLQINSLGNACLLHNLSKSTPDKLPDIKKTKFIEECNLSVVETERAKELIAYINELNIFKDPRKIETGLANIIQNEELEEIIKNKLQKDGLENVNEVTNPILDSLSTALKKLGNLIKDVRQGKVIDESDLNYDKKYLRLGGMIIDIDNSVDFFTQLLESYLNLNKETDIHPEKKK